MAPTKSASCCQRRTTLEKCLAAALVVIFAIVVAAFVIITLFIRFYPAGTQPNWNPFLLWQSSSSQDKNTNKSLGYNVFGHPDFTGRKRQTICDSSECVMVAHRMLTFMDKNEDPCQNFHRFACGGWQKKNIVRDHQLQRSVFSGDMVKRVAESLKHLLEFDDHHLLEKLKAFDIVRRFYSSCIRKDNGTNRGIESAKKLLDSIGTFYKDNLTDEFTIKENLVKVLSELILRNGASFFDISIDFDIRNTSNRVILITPPSHTSGISKYKRGRRVAHSKEITLNVRAISPIHLKSNKSAEQDENEKFIEKMSEFGIEIESDVIYDFMKTYIDEKLDDLMWESLEMNFNRSDDDQHHKLIIRTEVQQLIDRLRKIVPLPKMFKVAEENGELDAFVTIGDLKNIAPFIEWKQLLEQLFKRNFTNDDIISIVYPKYFKQLGTLFKNYTSRTINNAALALFFRDVLLELVEIDEDKARWQFCVDMTKTLFPGVLSAMYVRSFPKQLLQNIQKDVTTMFLNLKDAFLSFLDETNWMDQKSKERAKLKVDLMEGHFVSAKSNYDDDDYVEKIIENITVDSQNFFDNVIVNYVHIRSKEYGMYGTRIDKTQVFESNILTNPFAVNAYYLHNFNKIVVNLGILFPPYYGAGEPKYVTYGSIGTTIGHEIMHGFDSSGMKYDASGNLDRWISEDSIYRFRNKSNCFRNFYQNAFHKKTPFLGKMVLIDFDGNFTLNENIADNVGILTAFQAYNNWKRINGDEPILPGLAMSREQLFFLSAAQASCASMTTVGYVLSLKLDEHTPEPERVNGFLMNSVQFAEAYRCSLGSPMNPFQKCKL